MLSEKAVKELSRFCSRTVVTSVNQLCVFVFRRHVVKSISRKDFHYVNSEMSLFSLVCHSDPGENTLLKLF